MIEGTRWPASSNAGAAGAAGVTAHLTTGATASYIRSHAPLVAKARLSDETWEGLVLAQVGGIELDDEVIARVVAVLGSARRPVAIDRDGPLAVISTDVVDNGRG